MNDSHEGQNGAASGVVGGIMSVKALAQRPEHEGNQHSHVGGEEKAATTELVTQKGSQDWRRRKGQRHGSHTISAQQVNESCYTPATARLKIWRIPGA